MFEVQALKCSVPGCVLRYNKEAPGVREERGKGEKGLGSKMKRGEHILWALSGHCQDLDFDSEGYRKMLEGFKDVVTLTTGMDDSQIPPGLEAGRSVRRTCLIKVRHNHEWASLGH